jgi:hypothetical protein
MVYKKKKKQKKESYKINGILRQISTDYATYLNNAIKFLLA